MSRFAGFVSAAIFAAGVSAQETYSNTYGVYTVTQDTGGDVPLASKHFEWPHLPEKADTGDGPRGIQIGYNICNDTTRGDDSMCQTAHVNDIKDFCIWGAAQPDSVVADIEAGMVAYCTKDTHGSRIIQPGTLQGVQWITTPDYVEVVGFLDQTKIGLVSNDTGGEEDPHGADFRGNPLGSLVYSTAFKNADNADSTQVIEWDYFVGSGVFCFKACDPAGKNAASLCEHKYDEVGCTYNSPASYSEINGTFTDCKGENQIPVGVYVSNGQTVTWTQPYDVEFTVPYSPSIPATSQCSTYSSGQLYSGAPSSASSSGKGQATSKPDSSQGSSDSGDSSSGALVHGVAALTAVLAMCVGAVAILA